MNCDAGWLLDRVIVEKRLIDQAIERLSEVGSPLHNLSIAIPSLNNVNCSLTY
jgi:hypothetical protein